MDDENKPSQLSAAFPKTPANTNEEHSSSERMRGRAALLAKQLADSIIADYDTGKFDLTTVLAIAFEEKARSARLERENAELREKAYKDGLTGLANKATMQFALEALYNQHVDERRTAKGDRFVFIDLKEFKPINDIYGHAAGDKVLQVFGEFLKSQFPRRSDVVARMGGDEFCVLMRGATEKWAEEKMRDLEKAFQTLECEWQGETIKFRASIGHCTVDSSKTPEEILKEADERMYAHKRRTKAGSPVMLASVVLTPLP